MSDSTELEGYYQQGSTASTAGASDPISNLVQAPSLPILFPYTNFPSLGYPPSDVPPLPYSHPSASSEYQQPSGLGMAIYNYGIQPPSNLQPAASLPPYSGPSQPSTQLSTTGLYQHDFGVHPLHSSFATSLTSASNSLNHDESFNLPTSTSLLDHTFHNYSSIYPHFGTQAPAQADTIPPSSTLSTAALGTSDPGYSEVGALGLGIDPRRLSNYNGDGEAGPSGGSGDTSSWVGFPAASISDDKDYYVPYRPPAPPIPLRSQTASPLRPLPTTFSFPTGPLIPRRASDDSNLTGTSTDDHLTVQADQAVGDDPPKGKRRASDPTAIAPEWESITDKKERRKSQNKLAQRAYRARLREQARMVKEASASGSSQVPTEKEQRITK